MSVADRLSRKIAASGPMPLDQFLEQVMSGHEDSYYAGQDRFGEAGDFITAPEISQLFGEIVAAFLAWLWEVSGKPQPDEMMLFEAGPGRGTLFADLHRSWCQICPQMAAAPVMFLETSPYLRKALEQRFGAMDMQLITRAEALPEISLFGAANEFFDALAIRQAIKREAGWVWRAVTATETGAFRMADGAPLTDEEIARYKLASDSPAGAVAEFSPASEEVMAKLARHVARFGGGVLICDYGKSGPMGDSLQAVRAHQAVPVLDCPGQSDISHLVDFAALAACAEAQGARLIGPVGQGAFLRELGIEARAEALRQKEAGRASGTSDPVRDRALAAAVDRLCAPEQMGQIFKVAVLVPAGEGLPAGFASLSQETPK